MFSFYRSAALLQRGEIVLRVRGDGCVRVDCIETAARGVVKCARFVRAGAVVVLRAGVHASSGSAAGGGEV